MSDERSKLIAEMVDIAKEELTGASLDDAIVSVGCLVNRYAQENRLAREGVQAAYDEVFSAIEPLIGEKPEEPVQKEAACEECLDNPGQVPCPYCEGEGTEIEGLLLSKNPKKCENCDGTGYVPCPNCSPDDKKASLDEVEGCGEPCDKPKPPRRKRRPKKASRRTADTGLVEGDRVKLMWFMEESGEPYDDLVRNGVRGTITSIGEEEVVGDPSTRGAPVRFDNGEEFVTELDNLKWVTASRRTAGEQTIKDRETVQEPRVMVEKIIGPNPIDQYASVTMARGAVQYGPKVYTWTVKWAGSNPDEEWRGSTALFERMMMDYMTQEDFRRVDDAIREACKKGEVTESKVDEQMEKSRERGKRQIDQSLSGKDSGEPETADDPFEHKYASRTAGDPGFSAGGHNWLEEDDRVMYDQNIDWDEYAPDMLQGGGYDPRRERFVEGTVLTADAEGRHVMIKWDTGDETEMDADDLQKVASRRGGCPFEGEASRKTAGRDVRVTNIEWDDEGNPESDFLMTLPEEVFLEELPKDLDEDEMSNYIADALYGDYKGIANTFDWDWAKEASRKTANRVADAIRRYEAKITEADPEKVEKLTASLEDLPLNEMAAYQNEKSLACAEGKLTTEEGMDLYRILNRWASSSLAEKMVTTQIIGELMEMRMKGKGASRKTAVLYITGIEPASGGFGEYQETETEREAGYDIGDWLMEAQGMGGLDEELVEAPSDGAIPAIYHNSPVDNVAESMLMGYMDDNGEFVPRYLLEEVDEGVEASRRTGAKVTCPSCGGPKVSEGETCPKCGMPVPEYRDVWDEPAYAAPKESRKVEARGQYGVHVRTPGQAWEDNPGGYVVLTTNDLDEALDERTAQEAAGNKAWVMDETVGAYWTEDGVTWQTSHGPEEPPTFIGEPPRGQIASRRAEADKVEILKCKDCGYEVPLEQFQKGGFWHEHSAGQCVNCASDNVRTIKRERKQAAGDITVRLWSPEDLEKIDSNEDSFLTTVFMNRHTFSEDEIRHYPYNLRKEYLVWFEDEDNPETVYATDDESLKRFLEEQYDTSMIEEVMEQTRSHRPIELGKQAAGADQFRRYDSPAEGGPDKTIQGVRVVAEIDESSDASYLEQGYEDVEDEALRERYKAEDKERMENLGETWDFMFIWAEAQILIRRGDSWLTQKVQSGGLGGVESDSDEAYLQEIRGEELEELRGVLLDIGFSDEEIDEAFVNADDVGF